MKKKYLNLVLVLSIVFIWGYIIQKVFITVEPDEPGQFKTKKKDLDLSTDSVIKYELLANYPDPFRVKNYRRKKVNHQNISRKPNRVPRQTTKKVLARKVLWPSIQYKGRIKNHSTQENIAVLKLNGQGYRLAEKEIINEVEVSNVWKDSVLVVYQGEQKTFRLE